MNLQSLVVVAVFLSSLTACRSPSGSSDREQFQAGKELTLSIRNLASEVSALRAEVQCLRKDYASAEERSARQSLAYKKVELEARLAALKTRCGDSHPDVEAVKEQIRIIDNAIKDTCKEKRDGK